ncbi:MAG: tetratricopeptide repeat protein [Hyphomonas sp.]|nr:tetratricopeptide repeat protein [Hyphomonas sp.]
MKRIGAVSALLLAFGCAACATVPAGGVIFQGEPFTPPREASAMGDFLVARYASMTNDPDGAADHYASAMNKSPGVDGLAQRAVFAALLSGDYNKAVAMARRADAASRDATLVRMTLGVDAVRRGRSSEASAYLDGPGFGAFNQSIARGVAAWGMMKPSGSAAAESRLREGLSGNVRQDSATLYQIGLMQLAAGDDDAALETFETLWTSGTRLAVGVGAHARLLAARGQREEALDLLDNFRDTIGANAELERLATRIAQGREVTIWRPTAKQGAALAVYIPAATLMARTDDDIAGVYFVLALALDPELDAARMLWAQALERGDRPTEAYAVYDRVPVASPFYASARGKMAWILRRAGRDGEALALATQALEAVPDRDLLVQLADLYRSLDRFGEAVGILTEVIDTEAEGGQSDWRLLYARGASLENLGRWPEAEEDLRAALTLQPDNASVLNYLGYSYVDRGERIEEGTGMIKRALELNPQSGAYTDSLGWAYFRQGRYDMAARYLERAVELDPGEAVPNDHLGDAYWRLGRELEARFQWARVLKIDPDYQGRDRVEDKLQAGLEDVPVLQAESGPAPQRP